MNLSKETKISLIYLIVGLCWIYFSDTFLLIINNEKNFIIDYQLYKGFFYIVLSTIFLYFILHKNFKAIKKQEEMLSKNKIKEQKDFYNNVIDLVPHLIFAKDKDGNFLLANKAVADIYNSKSKDIIGKNHYKLHNKIFAYETKSFEHSDHEVLEKNKEVINEETVTNISGNSEIFHTRKIPLSRPDGENTVLGVAVNISELKEKEKQLEIDNKTFKTLNVELEESYNEIIDLAKKIEQIIDITASLDSSTIYNTDEFLSDLLHSSLKIITEADYGTVARIVDDKLTFADAFGYDIAKLNKLPITNKYLSNKSTFLYKLFKKHLKEVNDSLIVSFNDDHDKVALLYLSIDKNNPKKFNSNSLRVMSAFSNLANGFFKIQKYYQVEDEFQQELIVAITQILELHDTYTEGHSKEVAELSRKIAEKMNLSKIDTEIAFWAGMVHDIGKILVPNKILNKRGPLTNEEYNVIKKHPGFGYQTLEHSGRLKKIAKYILHHHERWDGNGYPKGLQNNEIPLISRILCVADSWNAMRSNRPYRNSLPLEKAINEIKINTGKQFCPDVVEAFKEVYNF